MRRLIVILVFIIVFLASCSTNNNQNNKRITKMETTDSKEIMETAEAKELLEIILQKNNFNKTNIDCNAAWNSFKEFSKQQFNVANDALLWEVGIYDFTGKDLFYYSMCRQFSIEPSGDNEGIEQLRFVIYFKPNAELKKLHNTIWTYDFNGEFEKLFQAIESKESFFIPPEKYTPCGYDIDFGGV